MYGFDGKVPPGGFPTVGYKKIMENLENIKNTVTIFPKSAYTDISLWHYYSQKSRWAFKRLLNFWREHKYKNVYGNDEDLYGNDISDTIPDDILDLWDGISQRYYRFPREDIVSIFHSKLKNNIHPKNPYTNVEFSFAQCIRIHSFLYKEHNDISGNHTTQDVKSYTRFPKNMLLNTQVQMEVQGFRNIKEYYNSTPRSNGVSILLREIIGKDTSLKYDKIGIYNDLKDTIFPLIINDSYSQPLAIVPNTKIDKVLYEKYIKGNIFGVLNWVDKWLLQNRKICRVNKYHDTDIFVNLASNSLNDT
jgi:hypothetical protein